MSTMPADLATLQRWMQSVIVHPGCVYDALSCDEAARKIAAEAVERVIKPTDRLTSAERVDIYHGMYLMRMGEALEVDYPTLRAFLGADRFADLARDYVQVHPSTSYTLNRLGDRLPDFVQGWACREDAGFLHDLARLERAVTEAFDSEESPRLSPEDAQAIPQEAWAGARLVPSAALRTLAFTHPVGEALGAMKRGEPVQRLRRRAAWIALWRTEFTVMRIDLSRAEHDLLTALAAGTPLGEALTTATDSLKSSEKQDRVFAWFRGWIARGMFSRVET